MTAVERKKKSEERLASLGIHIVDELPPMEEESLVVPRTGQEIAQRILVLTYLNCVAADSNLQQDVITFLKQESLWENASAEEKRLFEKSQLSEEDTLKIGWRGESIWLLLWTINRVDTLDLPASEVNIRDVFERLPAFMSDTRDFIQSASIRPLSEILDQSDFIFRLTWTIHVQSGSTNEMIFNPSIAYERHYAISWVTSAHETWDEIPES